jgi:DNA adenine methylase
MVGGAAPFWAFGHRFRTRAIGDSSPDLIALYRAVKDRPEELITLLSQGRFLYVSSMDPWSRSNYVAIQQSDPADQLEKAARTYFLLKAAINGLWRVNRAGRHNAAPGYKKGRDVLILDRQRIRACHEALSDTIIFRGDVLDILPKMIGKKNVFLLIDPPYHSDDQKGFTGFSGVFGAAQQRRLIELLVATRQRFIYLNRATRLIRGLWAGTGYPHEILPLRHSVGPAKVRSRVDHELIVWNL